jgi:hypothetical protein
MTYLHIDTLARSERHAPRRRLGEQHSWRRHAGDSRGDSPVVAFGVAMLVYAVSPAT